MSAPQAAALHLPFRAVAKGANSLLVGCGHLKVWEAEPHGTVPTPSGLLPLYGATLVAVVLARRQLPRLGRAWSQQ